MQIWEYAEMGYQEKKSSALLQNKLKESGFLVKAGVAGIPTAFVAEYNNGGPIIAILGEYDALKNGSISKSTGFEDYERKEECMRTPSFRYCFSSSSWSLKKYIESKVKLKAQLVILI